MSQFDDAVNVVLQHEGHLSNDKHDPGGITNYGISLRYLKSLGLDLDGDGDVDADDIRKCTVEDAKRIYQEQWWELYGYGRIVNQAVATKVFDLAVNMGARQAHRIVQRALVECGFDCEVDGAFGPQTLACVNEASSKLLLTHIREQAARFYRELVERKPEMAKFLHGWLNRAEA